MKMEPGRPASPADGPGPDPEPGGPVRSGAAPTPVDAAPHRGLGLQDPTAGLSTGLAPEASCLLPGQAAYQDNESDPDPDHQLPGLGPLFPWTKVSEDYGSPSCPDSPSLRAQDFSHSHHGRGEVDFFPSFPSPSVGELTLEVGPGNVDRPSDLSQTCPFTSEPSECPEDGPRLRAVFDALDGDGDGFVRIEDFVQFATVYGAEQTIEMMLDKKQIQAIFLFEFKMGGKAAEATSTTHLAQERLTDVQCSGGSRSFQSRQEP